MISVSYSVLPGGFKATEVIQVFHNLVVFANNKFQQLEKWFDFWLHVFVSTDR